MTEDDRATVERQLGKRYQIVRTLGAGAFGAVYLARERDLHRLVAIKVLRGDRAWSDDERERLLREARTIANLSHPAVVPLLAFGESNGMVYMVMPYVSGQTLADRLAHDEPFDADEVRRILIEVADALAYVHGEGVLHRDLKPENVLLERAGAVDDHIPPRVRLIDFGVAAFPMRDLGVNATRETWGTPHFMAPEQMFGEPELDPRSEIYSLGVLGFLLLGGRLPFDATSPTERLTQQRKGPVVPLSVCAPDAPKDLVRAIERCLAYDAEQRWRRARDFRDTLIAGASAGNSFTPLALVRQRLRPNPAAVERFAAKRRKRQATAAAARQANRRRVLRARRRHALRRAHAQESARIQRGDHRDSRHRTGRHHGRVERRRSARPAPCAGGRSESPRRDSGATQGPGSNELTSARARFDTIAISRIAMRRPASSPT